jgi:RecA-family ATPase
MSEKNNSTSVPEFEGLDIMSGFSNEPPALDLVLPGMLAGTVGSLVAMGGTGKSWLALQFAIAVAGGPDLAEIGPGAVGPVLYLPAEDPAPAIMHRLHALGDRIPEAERAALAERLRIVPLMGHRIDLFEEAWQEALLREAEGQRLLVLDTIRRFHSAEENSSGAMADLLGILEGICRKAGTSVLFLHHSGKGSAAAGEGGAQHAARGSSVLVHNVRGGQWNAVTMTEAEAKAHGVDEDLRRHYVRLVQAKANFGAPMPDRWLMRGEGGILTPVQLEKKGKGNGRKSDKASTQGGGGWRSGA